MDDYNNGKLAFNRAEELNPSIDLEVIGKVYLHYQLMEWAEEAFTKALTKMSSSSTTFNSNLVLLLAETEDVLGKTNVAKQLYEFVLQNDPKNALAHAALGLLQLGLGARNHAALQACGLDQEHAIDFCKEEIASVRQWRNYIKEKEVEVEVVDDNNDRTVMIKNVIVNFMNKLIKL